MVTQNMWNCIYFFSKLFPPNILKYDRSTKLMQTINRRKQLNWLTFYIAYSVPYLIAVNSLNLYHILLGDLSTPIQAMHVSGLCLCWCIVALYLICVHTIVFNGGGFILLFNTLSQFQQNFPGNCT